MARNGRGRAHLCAVPGQTLATQGGLLQTGCRGWPCQLLWLAQQAQQPCFVLCQPWVIQQVGSHDMVGSTCPEKPEQVRQKFQQSVVAQQSGQPVFGQHRGGGVELPAAECPEDESFVIVQVLKAQAAPLCLRLGMAPQGICGRQAGAIGQSGAVHGKRPGRARIIHGGW